MDNNIKDLKQKLDTIQQDLDRLNQIGIALSSEKNLEKLLEMIVTEVRGFTHCDAGTLYRINEKRKCLKFEILQTESTNYFAGGTTGNKITLPPLPMYIDDKPNHSAVAAYVAMTGEIVNIPDVYHAEGFDFSGPKKYDEITGYRTQSMLVIPMRDHKEKIIGVLQLINALSPDGERIPFEERFENLVHSMASQAAVAVNTTQLIIQIENLFKAMTRYTVKAIDARSPHTAGHSSRVAKFTRKIAEDINLQVDGPFGDVSFTEDELEEIWVAGLMHDVGKIGVPENVLEKHNKLDGSDFQVVLDRFERMKLLIKGRTIIRNLKNGNDENFEDEQFIKEMENWNTDIEFINWVNKPGYLPPEKEEILNGIAKKTFVDFNNETHTYLTEDEQENFGVIKGNLTDGQRKTIQNHVVQTRSLLDKLPFPDKLKNVPLYAGAHHEHLNGKGYPIGLTKDEIPLPARIMCVADVWDALRAQDRPYKPPTPLEKACDILRSGAKYGEFDPEVVELFINHELWEKKPGEISSQNAETSSNGESRSNEKPMKSATKESV